MVTAHHSLVDQIGDTAGVVWHYLHDNGPSTFTELAKEIDAPRDVVMQAVGWLAREDKISIEEEGRNKKVISLRA
ncbi:MAG TPA: winged helix-turn-helix domain-containing protein [Pirellulales bacterium]|jgi:hypothetical protein|nr:winged helix-turn-helix domain-containing protein [Pirellulales bacterium]